MTYSVLKNIYLQHSETDNTITRSTLLWIHGYTLDSSIWRNLWALLPEYHHIGIDLPGHGRSRPLQKGDSLLSFANIINSIAKKENTQHLLGLSFGGMIALQAAINSPNTYKTLILSSPSLSEGPKDEESATCNLELLRMAKNQGVGSWLTERWMTVPPQIFASAKKNPALFSQLKKIVLRHSWQELFNGSMQGFQKGKQLGSSTTKITASTTIIVGENDMIAFKRTAQLIKSAIPYAQCKYLTNTGHFSILEQPDISTALIRKLLIK